MSIALKLGHLQEPQQPKHEKKHHSQSHFNFLI